MKYVDGVEVYGIEEIVCEDESWCEHCGTLEPYTSTFDFDGVRYCMDCSRSDPNVFLSDEDRRQVLINELTLSLAYHKEQASNIAFQLEDLIEDE